MQPYVTIIIVNWNKKDDAIKLLDSVANIDYENYRIVVVDNASDDDSVPAINAHALPITLIENSQNLGGTGGFNTGLKYALENGEQDYVWLLDNDATVTPLALRALVDAMEADSSIALAGSKILNAENSERVVETGANIIWSAGNVAPLNQNCDDTNALDAVFEVDYVAICSALVRDSALRDVGIMDQRYFLLWDDMDWGFTFKQYGYRVVAVGMSKVKHAPFTEKRSVMVDYYLGVRNPLLTVSKHARGLRRMRGLLAILRRALYFSFLSALTGRKSQALLPKRAILDFLNNCWGKFPDISQQEQVLQNDFFSTPNITGESWLILPLGTDSEIARMVKSLRKTHGESIKLTLLVQSFRRHLFTDLPVDDFILFNPAVRNVITENLRTLIDVSKRRFDCAVTADIEKLTPFSFCVPRTYFFEFSREGFVPLNEGLTQLWRVVCAFLAGEFMAWVFFPSVYLKARFYQARQETK